MITLKKIAKETIYDESSEHEPLSWNSPAEEIGKITWEEIIEVSETSLVISKVPKHQEFMGIPTKGLAGVQEFKETAKILNTNANVFDYEDNAEFSVSIPIKARVYKDKYGEWQLEYTAFRIYVKDNKVLVWYNTRTQNISYSFMTPQYFGEDDKIIEYGITERAKEIVIDILKEYKKLLDKANEAIFKDVPKFLKLNNVANINIIGATDFDTGEEIIWSDQNKKKVYLGYIIATI